MAITANCTTCRLYKKPQHMPRRSIIGSILLLVYLGVLAWCCFGNFESLPSVQKSFFGIPTDKVVHFIMFLPFPMLCFWSFNFIAMKPWKMILAVLAVFLIGCAIAAGTEIVQSFTSYRTADPKDFVSDIIALGVSTLIFLLIYSVKHKTVA